VLRSGALITAANTPDARLNGGTVKLTTACHVTAPDTGTDAITTCHLGKTATVV
jgi:hypothetical protein